MDSAQIATLVGVALGSAVSSYFATKARVGKRQRELREDFDELARDMQKLEEKKLPTLSDERVREIVDRALRDYVTVEEFNAYARMDGQKRETLIEKVGELRGTIAELGRRR